MTSVFIDKTKKFSLNIEINKKCCLKIIYQDQVGLFKIKKQENWFIKNVHFDPNLNLKVKEIFNKKLRFELWMNLIYTKQLANIII